MKLYFQNSKNELRLIGSPATEDEATQMINSFCDERNFKIYYTRGWMSPTADKPTQIIDVGSHTEFFRLEYSELNQNEGAGE